LGSSGTWPPRRSKSSLWIRKNCKRSKRGRPGSAALQYPREVRLARGQAAKFGPFLEKPKPKPLPIRPPAELSVPIVDVKSLSNEGRGQMSLTANSPICAESAAGWMRCMRTGLRLRKC
jgi:hypothetical protein